MMTSMRTCSAWTPASTTSWQSGQLLSRATTDLSTIRRFAGFGVIFLITNVFTFVVVVALLIDLNLRLGLLTGCLFLPVGVLCLRFERRYRVLSRRAQDQEGDLATYVEEAATGIRVLKALGRRREASARHGEQARLVYETQVSKARLRGTFWASLDLAPNAAIGLILLLGAFAVSQWPAHHRRGRRLHHADAAAGLAHRGDGLHPGLGAGGGHRRAAGLRDPRHPPGHPGSDGQRARPPVPARDDCRGQRARLRTTARTRARATTAGAWSSTMSPSAIRARASRCSGTSAWCSGRARPSRWSGPTARARRPWCSSSPGSPR